MKGLVYIHFHGQIRPLGTNVSHLQHVVLGKLLLNVQVPVLNVSVAKFGVEDGSGGAGRRLGSTRGGGGSPSLSLNVGRSVVVSDCESRNGGLITFEDEVPVSELFQLGHVVCNLGCKHAAAARLLDQARRAGDID